MFSRNGRFVFIALMVLAVALLACKKKSSSTSSGSTTTTSPLATTEAVPAIPETPQGDQKLNTKVSLDGVDLTVLETKVCTYDRSYMRRSLTSKKEKLVGALVLFQGTNAERSQGVYSHKFKIVDNEGMSHNSYYASQTDCHPTLKGQQLSNGDKTKGWVIFKVPDSAKNLKLGYTHRRPFRLQVKAPDPEQNVKFATTI